MVLDHYAMYFGYVPGRIGILVSEGLRDLDTQTQLFNTHLERITQHAQFRLRGIDLIKEASKRVSPVTNNVPAHTTGGAIDIQLYDTLHHRLLDLGCMSIADVANEEIATFCEDIPMSQKENRFLMIIAAATAGLVNYPYEWWHYSYGDRYAAYWLIKEVNKREARYHTVDFEQALQKNLPKMPAQT